MGDTRITHTPIQPILVITWHAYMWTGPSHVASHRVFDAERRQEEDDSCIAGITVAEIAPLARGLEERINQPPTESICAVTIGLDITVHFGGNC